MQENEIKTPPAVMGLFDRPMWESIGQGRMQLQCCNHCGAFQYPPAPGCASCLSMDLSWKPVSGQGRILAWTIFHKQYLPAYPAPYNVIAVALAEGPVMVSNLEGAMPDEDSIGRPVELRYATLPDGVTLPRFRYAENPNAQG